jgi:hypothetical protein
LSSPSGCPPSPPPRAADDSLLSCSTTISTSSMSVSLTSRSESARIVVRAPTGSVGKDRSASSCISQADTGDASSPSDDAVPLHPEPASQADTGDASSPSDDAVPLHPEPASQADTGDASSPSDDVVPLHPEPASQSHNDDDDSRASSLQSARAVQSAPKPWLPPVLTEALAALREELATEGTLGGIGKSPKRVPKAPVANAADTPSPESERTGSTPLPLWPPRAIGLDEMIRLLDVEVHHSPQHAPPPAKRRGRLKVVLTPATAADIHRLSPKSLDADGSSPLSTSESQQIGLSIETVVAEPDLPPTVSSLTIVQEAASIAPVVSPSPPQMPPTPMVGTGVLPAIPESEGSSSSPDEPLVVVPRWEVVTPMPKPVAKRRTPRLPRPPPK